jgi:hypothetical protein
MTDANAPPVTMSTGTAPPEGAAPLPRLGARLNLVIEAAVSLAGFAPSDVRLSVSLDVVSVYALRFTAPTSRHNIASGLRAAQVMDRAQGKRMVDLTVEGAAALALRGLAAEHRARADDRVASARKALQEAEDAARRATALETRLANVVTEDLVAAGESAPLCVEQPGVP